MPTTQTRITAGGPPREDGQGLVLLARKTVEKSAGLDGFLVMLLKG